MAVGKDDVQRTIYLPKHIDKQVEEFSAAFCLTYAASLRLLLMKGLGNIDVEDMLKEMQKSRASKV